MFKLEFNTDSDAIASVGERAVANILNLIAREVMEGETGGKVRDANGNSIGRWSLDGE